MRLDRSAASSATTSATPDAKLASSAAPTGAARASSRLQAIREKNKASILVVGSLDEQADPPACFTVVSDLSTPRLFDLPLTLPLVLEVNRKYPCSFSFLSLRDLLLVSPRSLCVTCSITLQFAGSERNSSCWKSVSTTPSFRQLLGGLAFSWWRFRTRRT